MVRNRLSGTPCGPGCYELSPTRTNANRTGKRALASRAARGYRPGVTSPTPHSERRRAARAAATFPVQLAADAGPEAATLRDISEIGLACDASRPMTEMTLVGIDFALPGGAQRHRVRGAVVRCEALPTAAKGTKRWDVAIYFTEVPPATKAALRNYVAKGKLV